MLALVLHMLPFLVGIIWEGDDHEKKTDCFSLTNSSGIGTLDDKPYIMVRQKSYVPSLDVMGCPVGACLG